MQHEPTHERRRAPALSDSPPRFHLKRSACEAATRHAILAPVLKCSSRLLDFGSGSGEFLDVMQREGHIVTGIEPGESFAAHARKAYGVEVISKPWREVELPVGGFDVITADHVLEHLREPITALKRLRDWLADNGAIYIAVPNGEAKRDRSFQHFHFAHVHTFTPKTLLHAGLAAGLMADLRVDPQGTMVVFFKNPTGAEDVTGWSNERAHVAAKFTKTSPVQFLLSGRCITDSIRLVFGGPGRPSGTAGPERWSRLRNRRRGSGGRRGGAHLFRRPDEDLVCAKAVRMPPLRTWT